MTSWEKEKALRLSWGRSMRSVAIATGIRLDRFKYAEKELTPMTLNDALQLSKFFRKPIEFFIDDEVRHGC